MNKIYRLVFCQGPAAPTGTPHKESILMTWRALLSPEGSVIAFCAITPAEVPKMHSYKV